VPPRRGPRPVRRRAGSRSNPGQAATARTPGATISAARDQTVQKARPAALPKAGAAAPGEGRATARPMRAPAPSALSGFAIPTLDRPLQDAEARAVRTTRGSIAIPTGRAADPQPTSSGRRAMIGARSGRGSAHVMRVAASDQSIRVRDSAGPGRRPIARGNGPNRVSREGVLGMRRRAVRMPVRARRDQTRIARPAVVPRRAVRPGHRSDRDAGSIPVVRPAFRRRSNQGFEARIGVRPRIGAGSMRGARSMRAGRSMPGARARSRIGKATGTGGRRPAARPRPRSRLDRS
jgi:hypothetical protein